MDRTMAKVAALQFKAQFLHSYLQAILEPPAADSQFLLTEVSKKMLWIVHAAVEKIMHHIKLLLYNLYIHGKILISIAIANDWYLRLQLRFASMKISTLCTSVKYLSIVCPTIYA